jgi:hypothetical protein
MERGEDMTTEKEFKDALKMQCGNCFFYKEHGKCPFTDKATPPCRKGLQERDIETRTMEDVADDIADWIYWHVNSETVLAVVSLLISICSFAISIGRLVQYLLTH